MSSYLQKVLKFKLASDSPKIVSKKSLESEDTKYSLKTESNFFNESLLNECQESMTDSMCEGPDTNFVQRVPILSCSPTKHGTKDLSGLLFEVISQNNIDLCKSILEKYSEQLLDINSISFEGDSVLHLVSSKGYLKLCEIILDYSDQPHINIRNTALQTPLHLACLNNHLKIAQLLVRSGADLNYVDNNGNTCLHLASAQSNCEIVAWLLTRGPNILIKNNQGKTAEELSDEITASLYHKYLKRTINLSGPSISEEKKTKAKRVRIFEPNQENLQKCLVSQNDFVGITQIGKGSFGEVYLVRNKNSQKLYAMKVLRKEKIITHNLVRYALTERNVLSYIKHPFIVSLNFAFQTSEKLFLILDFCPGSDLSSHLLKEKRFSEQRAKIYICEILLALEELHKHDIIFRDLKPDNIVLDKEGHALLTDFGLSKEGVFDSKAAQSFCGSVAYLAPEMIKRSGHGKAVDWYLLGVVLYEMLVGMPPYFSSNKEELINNIQKGKLKIPQGLSIEAKELIRDVRNI